MLLPFDQLTRDGHRTLCVRVREPSRVHRPSEVQDQVPLFCFLNLIHLCLSLLLWLTNFRFILKSCFHSRMKRFLFLSSSTSNLVHSCEIVRERHRLMRSLADVHQPSYFCTDCNHVIASCAEYDLGNMFHVLGRGTLVTLRFLPQDLYLAVEPSYLSFQVFTSSLRLLVMTWLFAADLTMSAATSPKSAVHRCFWALAWWRLQRAVSFERGAQRFEHCARAWRLRDQGGQAECPELIPRRWISHNREEKFSVVAGVKIFPSKGMISDSYAVADLHAMVHLTRSKQIHKRLGFVLGFISII